MKKWLSMIFQYGLTIVGGLLVGIAVGWILLPVKISTGGFSGIATLLFYAYQIPADVAMLVLNIPLILISLKILGLGPTIKSLLGTYAISIGIGLSERFGILTQDIVLASIFGGALVGLGLGLAVRGDGTTGGTDLVAKIVHKKNPFMNLGQLILIIDAGIIVTSAIVFRDIDVALYSIVAVFVMTKVLDVITEGVEYTKAMFIISNKPEEIAEYILKEVGRGATGLQGRGMYTGENKEVLLCIVHRREIPKLKKKIKEIDNRSFTIITTATETIGEGFA